MTKFKPSFDPQKLVGKKFSKLLVIKYSHKKSYPKSATYFWECLCDCGNTTYVSTGHLNTSSTVSCGCHREFVNKNKGYTKKSIIKIVNEIVPDKNGCKKWPYCIDQQGYGKMSWKNQTKRASRIVYECFKEKIPKGLVIRHTCDNPACVNPTHLLIGTLQDNVNDAVERKRLKVGEAHHAAKLNEQIVKYIREKEMNISNSTLGRKYKVSHKNIERIKTRKIWKHI